MRGRACAREEGRAPVKPFSMDPNRLCGCSRNTPLNDPDPDPVIQAIKQSLAIRCRASTPRAHAVHSDHSDHTCTRLVQTDPDGACSGRMQRTRMPHARAFCASPTCRFNCTHTHTHTHTNTHTGDEVIDIATLEVLERVVMPCARVSACERQEMRAQVTGEVVAGIAQETQRHASHKRTREIAAGTPRDSDRHARLK